MKAGTYDARIVDYGISTTKDGAAQVVVTFELNLNDEGNQRLTWFGSCKPVAEGKKMGGIDITRAALEKMGLSKESPLRNLIKGPESNSLNMEKTIAVSVEMQQGQDGVMRPRIQWVGRSGAPNKADETSALAALQAMGLDDGSPASKSDTEEVPF